MTGFQPLRGEVWDINLETVSGHETGGSLPALVLSDDIFNEGPAELVVVAPITANGRKVRWHVPVAPAEGGMDSEAYIQCENVRSISRLRLMHTRGKVRPATLQQVEDRL